MCLLRGTDWIEVALLFKGLTNSPSVLAEAINGIMWVLQPVVRTSLAIRKKR